MLFYDNLTNEYKLLTAKETIHLSFDMTENFCSVLYVVSNINTLGGKKRKKKRKKKEVK